MCIETEFITSNFLSKTQTRTNTIDSIIFNGHFKTFCNVFACALELWYHPYSVVFIDIKKPREKSEIFINTIVILIYEHFTHRTNVHIMHTLNNSYQNQFYNIVQQQQQ